MKRTTCLYAIALLACLFAWSSCSDDPLADIRPEEELHGLVLQLQIDGQPVATPSATTRVAPDPTLNENLVEKVDVFFVVTGETNIYRYISATLGTDYRLVLAGADWKTQFPASSYDVYVVANRHDDTDNLSNITTVDQLLAQTDRDENICHVEGETILGTSEVNKTTYSGKRFLMDGKTTWTPPTTDDATIEVDLKRAAAKIVVNISYAESFFNDNKVDGITGTRKKLVNYVPEAMALAEATYQEMEVMGDAGAKGFSEADYSNGEADEKRIDRLYAYTYPNQWGDNMERETYLLLDIPYSTGTETGDYRDHNYYKVPIRFSTETGDLRLDRNTQYTVNVTIDRAGNTEIDEPVPLTPTFSVAAWKSTDINVKDDNPKYLVVNPTYIEMHNVADTTISFFSSSALQSVEVTDAYFINKFGVQKAVDQNIQNEWKKNISWDKDLTGKITFKGTVPDNVTAWYVTLKVTNGDTDTNGEYLSQEVEIILYPLNYIMGVEGTYSTRDDFTGNTYYNYKNQIPLSSRPTTGGYTIGFQSKVYYEGQGQGHFGQGIYTMTYETRKRQYYLKRNENDKATDDPNNRMYLVQITSTNDNYTVARPKMVGTGNDITTESSSENNQLVSPAFMLASQLGTVYPMNWEDAQEHCKQYVEVIDYERNSSGTNAIKELKDWRLPTFAELKIIAGYQTWQNDIMDVVLGGEYYWTAEENRYLLTDKALSDTYTEPEKGNRRTECYIRCIRDVTPADLAEFERHGIR